MKKIILTLIATALAGFICHAGLVTIWGNTLANSQGTNNTANVTLQVVNVPSLTVYVSHGALTKTNDVILLANIPYQNSSNYVTTSTWSPSSTNYAGSNGIPAEIWNIPYTNFTVIGFGTIVGTNNPYVGLQLSQ